MNDDTLAVRDRPWSFWGGAVLIFFGVLMMALHPLLPDRDRELKNVLFWVNMTFLVVGGLGCWRGRSARFDASTRQLTRGGQVVRDLTNAIAIAIYRPIEGTPAHYVVLLLSDAPLENHAAKTMHELRTPGDAIMALAQGVPPGIAKRTAMRWRDALQVPVVQLQGVTLDL